LASYDVLWNGAHLGTDADLLVPLPPWTEPPPRPVRSASIRDDVERWVTGHPQVTTRMIATALGAPVSAVAQALYLLRKQERVTRSPTGPVRSGRVAAWQYRGNA
jgi:hypothetical protein